jgi:hypothetical protein
MQDMYAEDGEFDLSAVFTDTSPFCGHGSMRRQRDEMWETFEGLRMDPLEVFDMGGGRFVAECRHSVECSGPLRLINPDALQPRPVLRAVCCRRAGAPRERAYAGQGGRGGAGGGSATQND